MNLPPEAWVWLVLSLILAVAIDYGIVRTLSDVLRPITHWVFLIGRLGKLVSLGAWVYFFLTVWAPRYLVSPRELLPEWVTWAGWGLLGLAFAFAVASTPRAPFGGSSASA